MNESDGAESKSSLHELFPNAWKRNRTGPLLFAHRGCSAEAPENTFAAFDRAAELGIPGIELDVQQCAGGEVVVFHDYRLNRITGVEGVLAESRWEELRDLDVGSWFSEAFEGERPPKLDDLFARYGGSFIYDIELKHEERRPGGLERAVAELVRRFELESHCILSSFNPFALRAMHGAAPHLPQALIFSAHREVPWLFRRGRGRFLSTPQFLKPHFDAVREPRPFLTRALHAGRVIAWTVNDAATADEMLRAGAAGLISDRPDRLGM